MVADEVGELVGSGDHVVGALDSRKQVTGDAGDTDDGAGKLPSDGGDCVGIPSCADRHRKHVGEVIGGDGLRAVQRKRHCVDHMTGSAKASCHLGCWELCVSQLLDPVTNRGVWKIVERESEERSLW